MSKRAVRWTVLVEADSRVEAVEMLRIITAMQLDLFPRLKGDHMGMRTPRGSVVIFNTDDGPPVSPE